MKTTLFFLMVLFAGTISKAADVLDSKKFEISVPNGTPFQVEFRNAKYVLQTPDQLILVKGLYEIKGDTIVFTDAGGVMACPKDQKGTYRFIYENGTLKLTIIEEQCQGRSGMAAVNWREIKK